ncbi:hypothetical protein MtrunA17_Chr8g0388851 [Medicago truncatula]|uniref:Transmembrane protein n=1 Tax=Medicago truncatula TaxID=3880 RepID=A0A396GVK1_MEDTR|nr:hypothetical protein MtrunA17_Chr8g0388851 [Medicago truncatula]
MVLESKRMPKEEVRARRVPGSVQPHLCCCYMVLSRRFSAVVGLLGVFAVFFGKAFWMFFLVWCCNFKGFVPVSQPLACRLVLSCII